MDTAGEIDIEQGDAFDTLNALFLAASGEWNDMNGLRALRIATSVIRKNPLLTSLIDEELLNTEVREFKIINLLVQVAGDDLNELSTLSDLHMAAMMEEPKHDGALASLSREDYCEDLPHLQMLRSAVDEHVEKSVRSLQSVFKVLRAKAELSRRRIALGKSTLRHPQHPAAAISLPGELPDPQSDNLSYDETPDDTPAVLLNLVKKCCALWSAKAELTRRRKARSKLVEKIPIGRLPIQQNTSSSSPPPELPEGRSRARVASTIKVPPVSCYGHEEAEVLQNVFKILVAKAEVARRRIARKKKRLVAASEPVAPLPELPEERTKARVASVIKIPPVTCYSHEEAEMLQRVFRILIAKAEVARRRVARQKSNQQSQTKPASQILIPAELTEVGSVVRNEKVTKEAAIQMQAFARQHSAKQEAQRRRIATAIPEKRLPAAKPAIMSPHRRSISSKRVSFDEGNLRRLTSDARIERERLEEKYGRRYLAKMELIKKRKLSNKRMELELHGFHGLKLSEVPEAHAVLLTQKYGRRYLAKMELRRRRKGRRITAPRRPSASEDFSILSPVDDTAFGTAALHLMQKFGRRYLAKMELHRRRRARRKLLLRDEQLAGCDAPRRPSQSQQDMSAFKPADDKPFLVKQQRAFCLMQKFGRRYLAKMELRRKRRARRKLLLRDEQLAGCNIPQSRSNSRTTSIRKGTHSSDLKEQRMLHLMQKFGRRYLAKMELRRRKRAVMKSITGAHSRSPLAQSSPSPDLHIQESAVKLMQKFGRRYLAKMELVRRKKAANIRKLRKPSITYQEVVELPKEEDRMIQIMRKYGLRYLAKMEVIRRRKKLLNTIPTRRPSTAAVIVSELKEIDHRKGSSDKLFQKPLINCFTDILQAKAEVARRRVTLRHRISSAPISRHVTEETQRPASAIPLQGSPARALAKNRSPVDSSWRHAQLHSSLHHIAGRLLEAERDDRIRLLSRDKELRERIAVRRIVEVQRTRSRPTILALAPIATRSFDLTVPSLQNRELSLRQQILEKELHIRSRVGARLTMVTAAARNTPRKKAVNFIRSSVGFTPRIRHSKSPVRMLQDRRPIS